MDSILIYLGDINDNYTYVQLYIRTSERIENPEKEKYFQSIINKPLWRPSIKNKLQFPGFKLESDIGAFYDTIYLDCYKTESVKNTFAPVYKIHQNLTPLHKSIHLEIEVKDFNFSDSKYLCLASVNKAGKLNYTGGNFHHNWVKGDIGSFGNYTLSYEGQDEFYPNKEDFDRAKEEHLEGIIKILPWIATIDKFQHWLYTNPHHTAAERKQYWIQLSDEFGTGMVDWTGFEHFRSIAWQKQLHLFEVPFYYIEYGMAQLGALAVWRNFLSNKAKTIEQYKAALSLGYSKTISEIYQTAGIEFNFKSDYIHELMKFVKSELSKSN